MWARLSRAWARLRRANPADRLFALEALGWLATARLIVLLVPVRRLAGGGDGWVARADPDPAALHRIGRVLNAVGDLVPWRCKCLERAIAGKLALRVRGHRGTVFLGVARPEPGGPIKAHAWLRCGTQKVIGEEWTAIPYSVVARFPG